MNVSIILFIIGWILNFEAAFMALPCIVAVLYGEREILAFLASMALCLVIGIPLVLRNQKPGILYKEGFIAVAMSWIILSIMGALPFIFSGAIPNFVDALFETVSGFTTTGSSILSDVESLPYSVLFWRSFTHWIGGMGVLVFILSLLPLTGGYHMNLMKAESPGPSVTKLVPRVRSTAKILYSIYLALTVIQVLFLLIGKMPLFDALTITFGTAGTGGFGIKNDSMTSYSPYLQNVVTVFMILFGINFNVYFLLLIRKFKQACLFEELRYYLGIIAAAIVLIGFNIRDFFPTLGEAFRQAAFQVGSIITTTGFCHHRLQPVAWRIRTILVILMFGCLRRQYRRRYQVSRLVILLKTIRKELHTLIHPHTIKKIEMDQKPVEHEVVRSVNVFIITYLIIFTFSVLLISFNELDLVTNFTAVATALNNVGPGLELVGPSANFGFLSAPSKLVLIFDMLAGRLEIFPLLLLFTPSTWKKF